MNKYTLFVITLLTAIALPCRASDMDEFRIKREQVFEFTEKPAVTRQGDKITIKFETKGFCDVTVAVEDSGGRIIRHLASGVLGPNAPLPFQKNSKKQTIIWDGKDDQDRYVDDKDRIIIRVSLGLKPRFERTLYWSPHKRIAHNAPLLTAAPEGVYVFEGQGIDHLRLFDHKGNYVRTIYPFPAHQISKVKGLQTHTFPQDGETLPLKLGFEQGSLLTSGSSAWDGEGGHAGGFGAVAMAVYPLGGGKSKIALAYHKLNRLMSDGGSGGLPIQGPDVGFKVKIGRLTKTIGPTDIAFSPDGTYLYLTGYVWKTGNYHGHAESYHAVLRMRYDKQAKPEVFLGQLNKSGKDNKLFCVPTSVKCDSKGRVYVADYMNSRVQIFTPDGTFLKSLKVTHPALIEIDRKTGKTWAFSWAMIGPNSRNMKEYGFNPERLKPFAFYLGTFEKPVKPEPQTLPAVSFSGRGGSVTGGQTHKATMDFYAKEKTLWMAGRKATVTVAEANWMSGSGYWGHLGGWEKRGIRLHQKIKGEWKAVFDFALEAKKKVLRLDPAQFSRQRLLVHPVTGILWILEEQTGPGKSFYSVLLAEPDTGKIGEFKLPFDAEDMIFDIEGMAYLKTDREVVRFETETWREVPWDYGEERERVGFASSGALPKHNAVSALPIPGRRPVWFHSSGMWISPTRHLAVICNIRAKAKERHPKDKYFQRGAGREYTPTVYPGRSGNRVIVVFDKHGKIVYEDAVPGLTNADGLGIDKDDNLYVMVAAPRVFSNKRYFNDKSETLMKFRPGKAKFLSGGRASIPLPEEQYPKRSFDITKYGMGKTWAQGAEWMYGGVGYGGQGGSCTCWHARFQLDYFARSFVPELLRFRVAVLDTNGNLILRIGKYGNVDDGVPLIPESGIRNPNSVGGDEAALSHAAYVGIHTDRYLYIHDAGNGRILKVKLGYHLEEKVSLKNIPNRR